MSELPRFRYHPAPLATGSIVVSEEECRCCAQARGYIYTGPVYAVEELRECICPWCIADGSAAAKFNAEFVDGAAFADTAVRNAIIDEVRFRTPSYGAWQQEQWLSHCADACEFHGDASERHIAEATTATIVDWQVRYELANDDWQWATKGYRPGGDSAFYKFACRHCQAILLAWDMP